MKELNFDSGLVTYSLNGKCEVSFNPTDSNFVERLYNAFEDLDKKQDVYREKASNVTDGRSMFEFAHEMDAEMRKSIDNLFESSVCEPLFGGMNVYASANGLPLWCNLLLSVMDECESAVSKEKNLSNPRIAKYMEKWKKYKK